MLNPNSALSTGCFTVFLPKGTLHLFHIWEAHTFFSYPGTPGVRSVTGKDIELARMQTGRSYLLPTGLQDTGPEPHPG